MGELERAQTGGAESFTMMLVTEIAEQKGVDSTELSPPIQTTVNMDALGKLLSEDTSEPIAVEFTYSGHQITIEKEENLRIEVD